MKKSSLVVVSVSLMLLAVLTLAASAQTIPTWQPNTTYATGALVMFNGVEYKCIQGHTSQVGWEPPNVPALWQPVSGSPGPTPTPTPTPTPRANSTTPNVVVNNDVDVDESDTETTDSDLHDQDEDDGDAEDAGNATVTTTTTTTANDKGHHGDRGGDHEQDNETDDD